MDRYCAKCGTKLSDNVKFCPVCGAPIKNISDKPYQNSSNKTASVSKNQIIVISIVVLIIILGIIGCLWYKSHMEDNNDSVNNTMQTNDNVINKLSQSQNKSTEAPQKETTISKTQNLLSGKLNPNQEILASTLGHNENGALILIKDSNNTYQFIVYDQKNHRIAYIPFTREIYEFYNPNINKLGVYIIFLMRINNDTHDKDYKLGDWIDSTHEIPIFANFEVNQYGDVVPGMLHSGWGHSPSHYQAPLYEQKNVDTVNLLLTEMKTLHQYIEQHNVPIPESY